MPRAAVTASSASSIRPPENSALRLVNPELDLTALTWSPDSVYVAVGCAKGVVRIWNVAKGTLVIGPTSSSTNRISQPGLVARRHPFGRRTQRGIRGGSLGRLRGQAEGGPPRAGRREPLGELPGVVGGREATHGDHRSGGTDLGCCRGETGSNARSAESGGPGWETRCRMVAGWQTDCHIVRQWESEILRLNVQAGRVRRSRRSGMATYRHPWLGRPMAVTWRARGSVVARF